MRSSKTTLPIITACHLHDLGPPEPFYPVPHFTLLFLEQSSPSIKLCIYLCLFFIICSFLFCSLMNSNCVKWYLKTIVAEYSFGKWMNKFKRYFLVMLLISFAGFNHHTMNYIHLHFIYSFIYTAIFLKHC